MGSKALKNTDLFLKNDRIEYPIFSENGRSVSEEEYWENYYQHPEIRYEWVNGKLEELEVSNFDSYALFRWFRLILELYLQTYKTGKIVEYEFGFRLQLKDKLSIIIPDLAVIKNDNEVLLDGSERSFKGVYDMCIEVISESKKAIARDTKDKKY